MLREGRLSALDLSGNYMIQTPDLVAVRLDQPNAYPSSRDIQQVFANDTSEVARLLLLEPTRTFHSVTEVHEVCRQRGGTISLPTVSRALKGLHEEVVIHKARGQIRLLQARVVWDQLTAHYNAPRPQSTWQLRLDPDRRVEQLNALLGVGAWVWDGLTSASRWSATTPALVPTLWARSGALAPEQLRELESRRFYNTIVHAISDGLPFFDARGHVASPLECALALMQGDKRDQEVAASLSEALLTPDHPLLDAAYEPTHTV